MYHPADFQFVLKFSLRGTYNFICNSKRTVFLLSYSFKLKYLHISASIGDVDGDGVLDFIARIDKSGDTFNRKKRMFSTISSSTVVKISLHHYLKQSKTRVNVDAAHTFKDQHLEKNLIDVDLLPSGQQIWTSYMGKMGNGYYDMT